MRSEYTTFHFDDGQADYTPHNFNNKYADGEITLAQALAVSDNIYAVKTHLFYGRRNVNQNGKEVWHIYKNGSVFRHWPWEPQGYGSLKWRMPIV